MKAFISSVSVFALSFIFFTGLEAGGKKDDEKEVKLKGSITCPKCDLKVETKCMTVIVVKKDGKDVIYYFDKEAHKKYHKDICEEAKKGEVTGVIGGDEKKRTIMVKSLKYE
jgi:hypothetical protein